MNTERTLFSSAGMKSILDKMRIDREFKNKILSLQSYFLTPPSLTCVMSENDVDLFVEETLSRDPRKGLMIFILPEPTDTPSTIILFNNGITKKETL